MVSRRAAPEDPRTVEDLLAEGGSALRAGNWTCARGCFEQAAGQRPCGEALDGLAQALFALGDHAAAVDRTEQAFAAFRAEGDDVRAAVCARFVGYLRWVVDGDGAAMSGWLARAVRLMESAGDRPERARLELTRATVTADPEAREQHLAAAVEIAQRHGLADVLLDAMSLRGLHLVAAGDVTAGMALLDEALAAVAAGEVEDLIAVGAMYCKMLHACELISDVRRAEEWLSLAEDFVRRTNRIPIGAICRTHYGGVLTAAGRWLDAERELTAAVELYDRSYRALRGAAVVRLADLRVRQGRVEEAAQLLAGADHDSYALRPRAEVHLLRGENEVAVARLERFLDLHPRGELTATALLLLVRAHLAREDVGAAAAAAAELGELANKGSHSVVRAAADHGRGLAAAAAGTDGAARLLESAAAAYGALALPLEEARARLDLARVLAADRPAVAVAEARAALRSFQALPAVRDADAAAGLLRRLGVRGHSGPRTGGTLTAREQEVVELLCQGLSNGEVAARLYVSPRTAEHHVSNILAKLGLRTRAEVPAYCIGAGTDGGPRVNRISAGPLPSRTTPAPRG
jgi:DNA-binding CsgD family transcriptional regulator/tetratricopeptide (TPR) repeat protein